MLWIVFEFGCLWVCIVVTVACYSGLDLLACGFLFALFGFDLARFYFVGLIGWVVYLVYIVGFAVFRLFCVVILWFVLVCCGVVY